MNYQKTISVVLLGFVVFPWLAETSCLRCQAQQDTPNQSTANPFADMMVNALFDKRVQAELALAEDQQLEIKSIMAEIQVVRKEMSSTLNQFAKSATREAIESKRQELAKQFAETKKASQSDVFGILLPHQQERLGQLTAQLMLKESAKKNDTGFLADEMKKYLGIDEQQAEDISKKAAEIKRKLAEDIKELTRKAQAELMDQLTPEQQKKYKSLVGDPLNR